MLSALEIRDHDNPQTYGNSQTNNRLSLRGGVKSSFVLRSAFQGNYISSTTQHAK